MKERKWLLLISIIAVISFLTIFYFNVSEIAEQTNPIGNETRIPRPPMPIPINYRLWLSPLLLIIAIIPISYYFVSKRLETKLESNMKIISKLIGKNNLKSNKKSEEISNKNTILKLLNFNERKILERLIEKNGEILQSEISRMEGMNKLKTHRAIKNLELKSVIKTESHGKTKRVILSKDIKNVMLK